MKRLLILLALFLPAPASADKFSDYQDRMKERRSKRVQSKRVQPPLAKPAVKRMSWFAWMAIPVGHGYGTEMPAFMANAEAWEKHVKAHNAKLRR